MDNTIFFIICGVLFLCVAALLIVLLVQNRRIGRLERRCGKFLQGKKLANLEQIVTSRFEDIDVIKRNLNIIADALNQINDMYQFSFQKLGLVRYNAFDEMGGNLSFALALLNKENNGFVMNSVHSTSGCYTYVKEIVKGESYVMLGNEERAAVRQAVQSDDFMH